MFYIKKLKCSIFLFLFLFIIFFAHASTSFAANYYLSPSGNDTTGNGTIDSPWFTLNKVWTVVSAGDTVYLRGGTYQYLSKQSLLNKNGTAGNLINVWAYPNEQPIITKHTNYIEPGWINALIYMEGNYTYWKGIEISGYTQASTAIWHGMAIRNASHNKFEQINSHHNGHGMLIHTGSTDNLVLNSDFHHNYDPLSPSPNIYGDADGLEIADIGAGSENIVRGCRFYNNSDDGLDLWNNNGNVIIDNNWSWNNGYKEDGVTPGGNGTGFKLGRTTADYSNAFLRTISNSLAFNNRANGFDENGADTKMIIYNNIAYLNGNTGMQFSYLSLNNANIFRNNINFLNLNENYYGTHTNATVDHNSYDDMWQPTGPVVTTSDFISVDSTGVDGSRQSDGSLPDLNFLKLREGSSLINAGIDVGLSYNGSAPDIGAYESNYSIENILTTEGTTTNDSTAGAWSGVNIIRSQPTTFTYRNNSITSVNSGGYILQAGDESVLATNNNLSGETITGNKLTWNGTDMTSITHGIFTGYNTNALIKYNYLDKVPMSIIRKSNGMTNTSGGVAYNIINKTNAVGVVVKGMNGVNIYNNTFYSDENMYVAPGNGTWRGLIDIYSNTDNGLNAPSTNTKIKNNIFYTRNQIYNIYVYDVASLSGFESDYNVFYSEAGTPIFNYLGQVKTFAQWQALGYDTHSVVINPNFNNFTDFVPSTRLDYGTNLGSTWQAGLSTNAVWSVGISPSTTNQNGTWQVGARIAVASSTPPSDSTAPTISSFSIPTTSTTLTISPITLSATDTSGIGGYLLNETGTTPNAGSGPWQSTPPTTHTFTTAGTKTLYAFAKDTNGNVSTPSSDTITITLPVVVTPSGGGGGGGGYTPPPTTTITCPTGSTLSNNTCINNTTLVITTPTLTTTPTITTVQPSTPSYTFTTRMTLGTKGTEVLKLQEILISKGYLTGTPDGSYGPKTLTAVKAFQRAFNLTPDGIIGVQGRAILNNTTITPTYTPTTPTLPTTSLLTDKLVFRSKANNISQVKLLQTILTSKGYLSGTIDGIFGRGTLMAVKSFQLNNNLTPDGVVGKMTREGLNR